MRIVLTGGGTGGHLIPFEPVIEAVRTLYLEQKDSLPPRLDPQTLELKYLGIADAATQEFFAHFDVQATHIPSGKIRRYPSAQTFSDLLIFLPVGIMWALWYCWRIMPDVIISKGGYGSIPVLVAATLYRIPFLFHESDATTGLANSIAARFAAAIAVGFVATKEELPRYQYKTVVTGIPVREKFGRLRPDEAKKSFGFAPTDSVVLVMGGSQGAQQLNEVVLQVLPELVLETGIIHVTGTNNFTAITSVAKELLSSSSHRNFYKPYPYLTDTIITAMTAADVVVSRAGATTLAELARLRKPMLLIPLSGAANDHQRLNAQVFERAGAARVLDPDNLGKNLFLLSLRELIHNQALRQELSQNAAALDYPEAARGIAELAFKLAAGFAPAQEKKVPTKK